MFLIEREIKVLRVDITGSWAIDVLGRYFFVFCFVLLFVLFFCCCCFLFVLFCLFLFVYFLFVCFLSCQIQRILEMY